MAGVCQIALRPRLVRVGIVKRLWMVRHPALLMRLLAPTLLVMRPCLPHQKLCMHESSIPSPTIFQPPRNPRPTTTECPSPLQAIVDGSWMDSSAYLALSSLTQGPRKRPIRLLGISLFDGLGAFWLLFQPFLGRLVEWVGQYSCEVCPDCCALLRHRHPNVKLLGPVEFLTRDSLVEVMKDSGADVVILAGGSPCQQISKAGCSSDGLSGRDSSLFWQFVRVSNLCSEIAHELRMPIFVFSKTLSP